jgi:hypothetical protein
LPSVSPERCCHTATAVATRGRRHRDDRSGQRIFVIKLITNMFDEPTLEGWPYQFPKVTFFKMDV